MGKNILQTTNKRVRPLWLCPLIKKIFTLFIWLLLLPVTALAADTNTVYVGGVELVGSHDNIVYATTNESGEVITNDADADNYNIKWDGNTLTLKGAYITKEVSTPGLSSPVEGAAIGVYNQSGDANLTITLEGTNTIKDVSAAIHVFAPSGSASLTITGDGILSASSGYNPGIRVQSNTGNGTLAITGAKVTASSSYSGNGVQIRCGDSSNASLTVNGGSLTATGSGATFAGIIMQFGSSTSGSGTPTVTVSDNAIVRANGSAGGITSNSSAEVQTAAGTGESGGIVFDNGTGTVYGDVELQEDITIGEGESLTIPEGASLDTNGKLTVNGGTLNGTPSGSVTYKVTGVSLSLNTLTLDVGDEGTLTATITPDNASNKSINWESSDTGVATVDANGKVTAVSVGSTAITATAADGSGKSATCSVTVNAKPTYTITAVVVPEGAGSVKVNDSGTSATVVESSEVTLTATASEGYRFVDWVEGDQTVSTDATYIFTATGDRTLTARFEKLYTVTVSPAEGGTATADKATAAAGETITLTAEASTDYRFTGWTSSNESVTFADPSSVSTTFTMPAGDVTVTAQFEKVVTSVSLNKNTLELYAGQSETLIATVTPDDATNQNVTWSSDNEVVATVDNSGKVTAVTAGEANITVKTEDGNYTASCKVQVWKPATVEPSGSTNLSFTTDRDEFTLTATVRVDGELQNPNGSWTWTVEDENVVALVTLRSKAVSYSTNRQAFTIKGTGTTTITATYDDGTYRGLVDFKVSISKPTPPDPISYYNIYVEDVCDGVEVTLSNNVVREGNSISVYVKKDTVNYTFDNFKVYYKRSYYGTWNELPEGVQPGEYPIKNIWNHIYIKAEGAKEKEDPTGIESIEGVKVYTKDGSLYVQTPQREQVIIVSMSGAVVKNEEQVGLKQYHGLQPGIYIVRVGDKAYKLRLN